MLKKVKQYIKLVNESDQSFNDYYLQYMMKIQDQDIDAEVTRQIRFGLLQLSQYDNIIESDYRKLVNVQNARPS